MNSLDCWRLCEELTIVQAALLLAEHDPSDSFQWIEGWDVEKRPHGYEGAKTAIANALRRGTVTGKLARSFHEGDDRSGRMYEIEESVNVTESRVDVDSLREWLRAKGFRSGFFFPAVSEDPDYLDPKNDRYAAKLAAAVRAWQAVTDPKGKHAKQALIKWLRQHAAEFALADKQGKLNEQGIDQVASVANWNPLGGAPKTPTA